MDSIFHFFFFKVFVVFIPLVQNKYCLILISILCFVFFLFVLIFYLLLSFNLVYILYILSLLLFLYIAYVPLNVPPSAPSSSSCLCLTLCCSQRPPVSQAAKGTPLPSLQRLHDLQTQNPLLQKSKARGKLRSELSRTRYPYYSCCTNSYWKKSLILSCCFSFTYICLFFVCLFLIFFVFL